MLLVFVMLAQQTMCVINYGTVYKSASPKIFEGGWCMQLCRRPGMLARLGRLCLILMFGRQVGIKASYSACQTGPFTSYWFK
jgi:hypothetical protein